MPSQNQWHHFLHGRVIHNTENILMIWDYDEVYVMWSLFIQKNFNLIFQWKEWYLNEFNLLVFYNSWNYINEIELLLPSLSMKSKISRRSMVSTSTSSEELVGVSKGIEGSAKRSAMWSTNCLKKYWIAVILHRILCGESRFARKIASSMSW